MGSFLLVNIVYSEHVAYKNKRTLQYDFVLSDVHNNRDVGVQETYTLFSFIIEDRK